MADCMLSTIDNPFNPFDNYTSWFAYDVQSGYYTPSYLARIVKSSPDLSEPDQELAIEQAIDEIVSLNINGMYMKVTRDTIIDPNLIPNPVS